MARGWKVALSGCLVATLCGGAIWTIEHFVDRAVIREAARRSTEWAEYATTRLPRIAELAQGAMPTDAEQRVIEEIGDLGGMVDYRVFSPDGHLQFASTDPFRRADPGTRNPDAARVVATRQPFTVVEAGQARPERPDLYSETYLPVLDGSGKIVAIAQTYLDQTEHSAQVRADYCLFGVVILALLASALILMSAAVRALLRSLRYRDQALNTERTSVETADRAKVDFLATIVHELRTPMNGIVGAVQLLDMANASDADVELLDILRTSADTQMSLIEELTTFSELDAGVFRLRPEPVAFASFLRSAVGMGALAAADKGLAFDVTMAEDDTMMIVDPRRMRQVVSNLVGNAVKFTEAGGVYVKAGLQRLGDGRGSLRLEVTDTGPGIPADQHARIFGRFTQLEGPAGGTASGIGLGLAIVDAIVDAMGGQVAVQSVPRNGSTFTVTVPVVVQAADGLPDAKEAV
ncbi:HAMP domain-containing sensor histidine kinase [uncultured Jannaschia sp.]|uniref:sensor histidine kinase n=1 Tax=uncultured Jannaschia sp. TaxID=293347 RepID=UPI00260F9E40|nr:HAMP domain-containing sensor histidine kinase [uncultured Jannaschia sp.]